MTDLVTPGASPDIVALVRRYVDSWNETDRDTRDTLIAQTWDVNGTYIDPMLEATGRLAISEMIEGFQETYPGHLFSLLGTVEAHHGRVRARWQLTDGDGTPQLAGTDFGLVGADTLLVSMTGFFDGTPE